MAGVFQITPNFTEMCKMALVNEAISMSYQLPRENLLDKTRQKEAVQSILGFLMF